MSNPAASAHARKLRTLVLTLLASRSQALPLWTRKGLQRELALHGYTCSLRSVQRYVNTIRGER
jgi:hypothetical protein